MAQDILYTSVLIQRVKDILLTGNGRALSSIGVGDGGIDDFNFSTDQELRSDLKTMTEHIASFNKDNTRDDDIGNVIKTIACCELKTKRTV